jgi:hypothetical protein
MPKRREKQMTRFLLPCTSGVEMDALEALVHLAADQRATLMPLSLIPQPPGKHQKVRLELLQQSQDFLVAVQSRAARYQVPLEPAEVLTRDLVQGILVSISTYQCDALLFAARVHRGCPLPLEVVEHLLRASLSTVCCPFPLDPTRAMAPASSQGTSRHCLSGSGRQEQADAPRRYPTDATTACSGANPIAGGRTGRTTISSSWRNIRGAHSTTLISLILRTGKGHQL